MAEVPLRISWLPGEVIIPPRTVPCPPDGGRCELALGPVQQPGAAGLRVTASARGCEVFVGAPGAAPAYECTLRGVPASGYEGMYALEYAPKARLRPGTTVTLRLVSLADKAAVCVHSAELLGAAGGAVPPSTEASPASQMEGIREMLAQLAAEEPGGGSAAAGDPRRALAASIARSALAKGASAAAAAPTHAPVFPPQAHVAGGGGGDPLISELVAVTRRQTAEIVALTQTVARLEAVCLETRVAVGDLQARLGGASGTAAAPPLDT